MKHPNTHKSITAKQAHETELLECSLHALIAMSSAIDAKDAYTNGHSVRVAQYSELIAKRAGLSEQIQDDVFCAALLHDVGKIGIPDYILANPSTLSDDEFTVVKSHPIIGYNILKHLKSMPYIAVSALNHHERYDGCGYPTGLNGNNIPILSRIIAVADAYDAMTSSRSYRVTMPQNKVYHEIESGRYAQFDPLFAETMMKIIDDDKQYTLHV